MENIPAIAQRLTSLQESGGRLYEAAIGTIRLMEGDKRPYDVGRFIAYLDKLYEASGCLQQAIAYGVKK
jgi:hypothetical protein